MDFTEFSHLTFDCYGTLIDWETGILTAVMPIVECHGASAEPSEVLRLYVKHEAQQEAGPYQPYRQILRGVLTGICDDLGLEATEDEFNAFSASVGSWPPFSDTVESLKWLQQRYKLVIVSNVDDDLFAQTQALLGVRFDEIITAQQIGAYKPAKAHFETALKRLNVPVRQILHVAQSLYHDHAPAKEMGFQTVWVNRPSLLSGTGLSPASSVIPDLEVPDLASLTTMIKS